MSNARATRILLWTAALLPALASPAWPITAGEVGSVACGDAQAAVQTAVGDESRPLYRTHGSYLKAVTRVLSPLLDSGAITNACASCITTPFAERVAVAAQRSCGLPPVPAATCQQTVATPQQILDALIATLDEVVDPWGSPSAFATLLDRTERRAGCLLGATQSTSPAGTCAAAGVNYCGPGNSTENPALLLISYPACLNDSCCGHDACYGAECVAPECDWTPQSQTCDDALVATCNLGGTCTAADLVDPGAIFVCTLVQCLNATLPFDLCAELRAAHLALEPQCTLPPPDVCAP